MSQHDYVIDDQVGVSFLSDLNAALAAIVSSNSGATEPTATFAHMWWADTTAGTLKRRNAANNAWISVMSLTLAISAFIETLLTVANAAAARTVIGAAEVGVNASITEIAGLTTPLSVGQGGTGGITAALARASLGALAASGGTLTAYRETVVSANSTAAYEMNCNAANVFNLTLTANCTLSFANIPAAGAFGVTLALKQDGTGSRLITWPANTRFSGGTAPVLTTTPAKTDFVSLITFDAGANWYGFVGGKNF